jgi:hypothetical protein
MLMVFALNTVVAFACSMGLDMGFNRSHHGNANTKAGHSHKEKHSHGRHSRGTEHKHAESSASSHKHKSTDEDNCCNKTAVELQKFDKSSSHSPNPVIKVPVLLPLLFVFAGIELQAELNPVLNKTLIPQYYPPPDRRILFQSFLI